MRKFGGVSSFVTAGVPRPLRFSRGVEVSVSDFDGVRRLTPFSSPSRERDMTARCKPMTCGQRPTAAMGTDDALTPDRERRMTALERRCIGVHRSFAIGLTEGRGSLTAGGNIGSRQVKGPHGVSNSGATESNLESRFRGAVSADEWWYDRCLELISGRVSVRIRIE